MQSGHFISIYFIYIHTGGQMLFHNLNVSNFSSLVYRFDWRLLSTHTPHQHYRCNCCE